MAEEEVIEITETPVSDRVPAKTKKHRRITGTLLILVIAVSFSAAFASDKVRLVVSDKWL
jgi:hypothetical protein